MAQVNYDQSDKILAQAQPTGDSCAFTCAAMCVNQTVNTLIADKFTPNNAQWAEIAAKYNYKLYPSVTTLATDFTKIINGLKGFTDGTTKIPGSPVIVKVNDGTDPATGKQDENKQHWVVVTKFSGDDAKPTADNFICADPYKYTAEKKLSAATRYTGLYNMRIYYKCGK